MVETTFADFKADPSQGSHFFHNITSLGINYLTVGSTGNGHIDWAWLQDRPVAAKTRHVKHIHLTEPATLKVDGRRSLAVLL